MYDLSLTVLELFGWLQKRFRPSNRQTRIQTSSQWLAKIQTLYAETVSPDTKKKTTFTERSIQHAEESMNFSSVILH